MLQWLRALFRCPPLESACCCAGTKHQAPSFLLPCSFLSQHRSQLQSVRPSIHSSPFIHPSILPACQSIHPSIHSPIHSTPIQFIPLRSTKTPSLNRPPHPIYPSHRPPFSIHWTLRSCQSTSSPAALPAFRPLRRRGRPPFSRLPFSSSRPRPPVLWPPLLTAAERRQRWTRNDRTMFRPRPCRRASSRRAAKQRASRTASRGRRTSSPTLHVGPVPSRHHLTAHLNRCMH